jgi:cytochrome P450
VNAHRAAIAPVTPTMITNTDAPVHTRLRRMVNAPFLIKRIEAMRPAVQKLTVLALPVSCTGPATA